MRKAEDSNPIPDGTHSLARRFDATHQLTFQSGREENRTLDPFLSSGFQDRVLVHAGPLPSSPSEIRTHIQQILSLSAFPVSLLSCVTLVRFELTLICF